MIGRRILTTIAAVGALVLSLVALPGSASAASGGGCTTGHPGGTSVRPCISYSGSASAIVIDGYVDSMGGNACLQIDRNWLLNGSMLDDGFSIVYGTFLGEVRSPQQNFP